MKRGTVYLCKLCGKVADHPRCPTCGGEIIEVPYAEFRRPEAVAGYREVRA